MVIKLAKKKTEEIKESAFSKLSEKHKLFVSHYCGDHLYNATKSYLATYKNVKYETAMSKGCDLVRKSKVKEAIEEISSKQFANIQSDISKNETYNKIKALSEMSIEDVIDLADRTLVVKSLDEIPPKARFAIKSIKYDRKETDTSLSENINVTFESKIQALKMLGEIQGLISSEKEVQQLEIVVKQAERPEE